MGSLAGLLWYSWLRRLDVSVSVWRFISIGAVVTIPALLLSLGLLEAGA
jgi:Na+/H+ antiporter NhaD/arsenite permease-like protein